MTKASDSIQVAESCDRLITKVEQQLCRLPTPGCYWLAYSGGVDSQVLLHILGQSNMTAKLRAIHVDHGLHPDADSWSRHCQASCEQLTIPISILKLDLDQNSKQSLEAQAREGRYTAMANLLGTNDMLLTAHHGDDQLETLLLQLLRGGGVRGLAAMPLTRQLAKANLIRPLLDVSRQEILQYADAAGLQWVEDSSNQDVSFDRNLLRHEVIPVVKKRWTSVLKTTARVTNNMADAMQLMDELAELDWQQNHTDNAFRLHIPDLQKLSPARQRNLVRHWLRANALTVPDSVHLQRIFDEVIQARQDASPEVIWQGTEVRRYDDSLYCMPLLASPEPGWSHDWSSVSLVLPAALGQLHIVDASAGIDKDIWDAAKVTVTFRFNGLSCTPAGRQGSRSFKRLCQDYGIPPWLRDRVPLIMLDGELAAVGDYLVCDKFVAKDRQAAVKINWQRPLFLA